MTSVPQTPTATDKLEEVRKLNIEIAKLTSIKDTADRDAKAAVSAAEDAKQRALALEQRLKDLPGIVETAAKEAREFVEKCQTIVRDASVIAESAIELVKVLSGKADAAHEDLDRTQESASRVHESAVKENEGLERKKKDLGIYQKRLEKHFAEHLPDQKILL